MLRGSIVALVTPFTKKGKINYTKLYELLDFHIVNKTDGILLFGTTGEGSTLTIKEKYQIGKRAIKYVKNRIPIILNAGTNNTKETIKNCRLLSKIDAYALLVITPYYNKSNDRGMYIHFKLASEASRVPIIIYNVPSRTGYDMPIKVIEKISKIKNVIGIKEASADENKRYYLNNLQNEEFYWYSGNDSNFINDMKEGAKGLIGVATNSHPKQIKEITTLCLSKEFALAEYHFSKIKKYIKGLSLEVNPIPIKEAMNVLGWEIGGFRLPLHLMGKENKNKLLISIGEIKE